MFNANQGGTIYYKIRLVIKQKPVPTFLAKRNKTNLQTNQINQRMFEDNQLLRLKKDTHKIVSMKTNW